MGGISAGVGLISGIDSASLIEQLLAVESRVKIPIQARIARLATAKSALLDINSSLLSLQSFASAFRTNSIFESVSTLSSNPDVIGVSTNGRPQPGSYSFLVKQLAKSSQYLSHGFASRDNTPLGLDTLSLELGNGRLDSDIPLSSLNGGDGVQRGIISITDRSGSSAEIDLSQTTSVNEVLSKINGTSGISIQASIEGDHILLTDLSAGGGVLTVSDGIGNSTASDLGIVGTGAGSTLVGSEINRLGMNTSLSDFNGGLGVFIRDGVTDFNLVFGATTYEIDLGQVNAPITGESLLEKLNNGDGISINDDPEEPDFTITSSTGVSVDIDLGRILDEDGLTQQDEVESVQDLIDRVNGALSEEFGPGQVTMTINSSSDGFVITDNLGGSTDLQVSGAGPGATSTADDLGILGSSSSGEIIGSTVLNEVQTARAQTIQDLSDRVFSATAGRVTVEVAADGKSLEFNSGNLSGVVTSGAPGFTGDPADISERTLSDLGFADGDDISITTGGRVLSGFGSALLSNINGGAGLNGAGTIIITDSSENSLEITGLDSVETVSELINTVNDQLQSAGVAVTMSLDSARSGVVFTDNAAGESELGITGSLAVQLGVDAISSTGSVASGNLEIQYVSQSTKLSDLNFGRGIGTGTFRLTDSTGSTATVKIDGDDDSLYEVMKLINTRGLEIRAEINANGDGINLIDTTSETGALATSKMKIEDLNGTVASSLRIDGEASSAGGNISGSYAIEIDLDVTDTMDDLISKLDEMNAPITATVLNTGAGSKPWYLSFTSSISGTDGDLVIDTGKVDLGLDELVQAQDAQAFVGSTNPAEALLVSSSDNQLDYVVDGLSIDLLQADDNPVTITVERDDEAIVTAVSSFTDSFNEVMSKINGYDSYDAETEVRGPLLGDSTVALVRSRLYATLQSRVQNVDGPYQYLSQVGIRLGSNGAIEFDDDKFQQAYASDPEGVEALFTAYDAQTTTSEVLDEIDPGISIEQNNTFYSSLGFGDIFSQLLEGLTDSTVGTVTLADERFQTQIESQTDRLELIDQRIDAKRGRLQREFFAMEAALAQMQSQQGALLSLSSNLNIAGLG